MLSRVKTLMIFSRPGPVLLRPSTVALMLQWTLRLPSVVCTECLVAKRCVLEQKLLLTAYRNSYMRNRLVPKLMTLTYVLRSFKVMLTIFQDGGGRWAICNHSAAICDRMSPTLKSQGVCHFGPKFRGVSLGADQSCLGCKERTSQSK